MLYIIAHTHSTLSSIYVDTLTSNGVVNGFLGLLYAKCEGLDIGPDLIAAMVEHKSILKVTHRIHCFSFLIESLIHVYAIVLLILKN